MTNAGLVDELVNAALKLIALGDDAVVDAEAVARAIGREPDDSELPEAFVAIDLQGLLMLDTWDRDTGLPRAVRA